MQLHAHCKIYFLLLVGSLPAMLLSQTNEGTAFWLGFMEHRDNNDNTKVVMITSKRNTSGQISMPNMNWNETFTVNANEVKIITMPTFAENFGSETRTQKGIFVNTQDPVSVYIHQYHEARSEASVILPTGSVGKEYYVMSYPGVSRQNIIYPSEFLIIANEDETTVSITVSDVTRGGKPPGTTFDITLNAGETYQVQAQNAFNDLTGSYLSGDKDFSLIAGNRWTQIDCDARDNLMEQMYPVSTWGRQFVTIPNADVNYDVFRILAASNNTTVDIFSNGTQETYTLNQGEFVEYNQSLPSYISASQSILVAQFMIGQFCNGNDYGDPSMVLLNSVEQTRDTVTLYNSSLEEIRENYINIIMATTDIESVSLDEVPLLGNHPIDTIGLNNEFAFSQVRVSTGAHTITSAGCGIIATAYGYGSFESYAYSGGASFKAINVNPIPEGSCLNDTIIFDTGLPANRYSFQWDLGDGTQSNAPVVSHIYTALGSYPVELILTDHCLNTVDTSYRDLLVSLRQSVESIADTLVCQGATVLLGATDVADARYEWYGPNNYFSEQQFPILQNADPAFSGTFSVVGIVSGCATFPAQMEIEIIPSPDPMLGPDRSFCPRDEDLILEVGKYSQYLWQDNSTDPKFPVLEEGTYWVEVEDNYGCIGIDTLHLERACPSRIYVPNAFSPNGDNINDTFGAYTDDVIQQHLKVFSRWGELLFETSDPAQFWDGTFRNAAMPTGPYTWTLQIEGYLSNGIIYSDVLTGVVHLFR